MLKKSIVTVGLVLGIASIVFAEVNPEPKTVVKAKWGKYEILIPQNGEFGIFYDGEWWKVPKNFTVDREGNIYISDEVYNRIQVFDQNGKFMKTIGNNVKDGFNGRIRGMIVDEEGNIFIADRVYNFKKFSPNGKILFEHEKKFKDIPSMFLNSDGNIAMDRGNRIELYSSEDGELIRTDWGYGKATDYERVPLTIKGHKGRKIPIEFRDHRELAKKRGIAIPEEEYGRLIGFDKDNNTYWEYGPKAGKYVIYIYDENGNLIQKLEPKLSAIKAPGMGFGPGRRFVVDYWGNIYQFMMYPEKGIEILKYEKID